MRRRSGSGARTCRDRAPPWSRRARLATLSGVADSIMDLVEGAMDSPWVYLAILAFAALDAFFPIVPSESW